MVTRPATEPYSSMTIFMCCFSRCISRRSSATFLVSGTKAAGRWDLGDDAGASFGVKDLEEVVGEGDAGDVVERGGVDRDAGESALVKLRGELAEAQGPGDGEDLGARGHDLEDDLVAKLDGGTDEFAVGLFEDALFFAGFEERVHGFGGMVLFGLVFGLCQCGDGEEELQQHCYGEDEVEEGLEDGQDPGDPEAASAGEEQLRQEAIEDEDEDNEFAGRADDLACARRAGERGDEGGVGVEAEARKQGKRDQGELAEDRGREGDGLAAEAETRFDDLFPGVDVVLVFAGEEFAHLEVDAVDVGGEGEDEQEEEECDGVGVGRGHLPPRLLRVGDDF